MLRLSCHFIIFVFCCLLVSPQVQAMPYTRNIDFFFDAADEPPSDADVIAEVTMTDIKQGHTRAMLNIGRLYEYGNSYEVKSSESEARKWYRLAVEKGNPQARTSLERLEKR